MAPKLPTSFRLSESTLASIETLKRPGESGSSVVTRAVEALVTLPDQTPINPSPERLDALESRLSALEARLQSSATSPDPIETKTKTRAKQSKFDYPEKTKQMALDMKQAGESNGRIADAVKADCGHSISSKNVSLYLKRWNEQIGLDAKK
jgi:hypothetical protein